MDMRYSRTLGALTSEEISTLQNAQVCVVGCGGLGGYVIEELARLGVGKIIAVDPDCFDYTNLNRQLLCTEDTIKKSKALEAAERIKHVNSDVVVCPVPEALAEENAKRLISGCNVVVDALDSAKARKILANACSELGLMLVHGAISGWRSQISVIEPGVNSFEYMYPDDYDDSSVIPSLSFTPALTASAEVAEAVKIILGRPSSLLGKLLLIDLKTMEFNTVKL